MSIRGKLAAMSCVVLIVILTMAGATWIRGGAILNDFLNKAGLQTAQGAADTIGQQFDKYVAISQLAAESMREAYLRAPEGDKDAATAAAAESILSVTKKDGVMNVYVGLESTGLVAIASIDGPWTAPAGFDCRNRGWYLQALAAKGEMIFTQPFVEIASGKVVIAAAKAIYDEKNALVGVAAVETTLDQVEKFVLSRRIFDNGEGFLLLQDGLVAIHSNKEFLLKVNLLKDNQFDASVQRFAERMTKGEAGFMDYLHEGREQRVFFAPVGHGFFLGIFFPVAAITAIVRGLTTLLLIIAAVALAVVGFAILAIVRGFNRSMRDMNRTTTALSRGDLTARFNDAGRDELALMSRELNTMLQTVSATLNGIRKESEDTAKQAKDLAVLSAETLTSMQEAKVSVERANSLASGAAEAAEHASASVQEIAQSAQSSAQTSTQGAEEGSQVMTLAIGSVEAVDSVVNGMKDVAGKAQESLDAILELVKSVEAISSFVDTIASIADQTNLLALNAAIEAARAGDAGRGFAVVAEEVRKLAENSGQASQEVSKLIGGLQRQSSKSVSATQEAGVLLTALMQSADKTQADLQNVMKGMGRLNDSIQNIAAIAEEQSAASAEIAHSMKRVEVANKDLMAAEDSILSSTQTTTHAAQSIALAAQKITETSHKLEGLVGNFILDAAAPTKRPPAPLS